MTSKDNNVIDFFLRFQKLCLESETFPTKVIEDLHMSRANYTFWRNGAVPRADSIEKICDYFGIDEEYFYVPDPERYLDSFLDYKTRHPEEFQHKMHANADFHKNHRSKDMLIFDSIISAYQALNEKQKKEALAYINFIIQRDA